MDVMGVVRVRVRLAIILNSGPYSNTNPNRNRNPTLTHVSSVFTSHHINTITNPFLNPNPTLNSNTDHQNPNLGKSPYVNSR